MNKYEEKNVLGGVLRPCSYNPPTGFFRDGFCFGGKEDTFEHTVCIVATKEFLEFSKRVGNDLSTPLPQYGFLGVKEGDTWCLCAGRWVEAYLAKKAPDIILEATHSSLLDYIDLDILKTYAATKKEENKGLLYTITGRN
jgi:uncharacterized protein